MQRLTIIGNIGQDAQIKTLDSGAKAIQFSVAVSEKYGEKESTTWYRCTQWKTPQQATTIAEYLKKGVKVFIEGKPSINAYKNKNGEHSASIELRIDRIELLSKSEQKSESFEDIPF